MEKVFRAKLNSECRLNIPATFRNKLGLRPGQEVLIQISNGGLFVYTPEQTLKRLQDWVASAVPPSVSLSDGLIADRRAEVTKGAGE
jgi:bifunctional DNA-binding transcriptional regulator/antitoxin component of YhaV-PrlF toxin-antitoxin module